MAITSVSDIATAMSAAQRMRFVRNFGALKAAGSFQSGWMATGIPGAGVASPLYSAGAGYTCDRTTVGALGQANGAVQNWLARLQASITQPGILYLADRLWSCSGMGFAAATYSVTTPGALPARITDDGVGCELWVENFVAAGASTGNFTVNYVNTAAGAKSVVMNVPGGVNPAIVSAPVAGQMQPVPIVAGDLGVKQLTSVANGSTFTSGTWGMTILKNIAQIEIPVANTGLTQDWSKVLSEVHEDACLFFYFLGNAVTAPVALGTAWIIDK